MNTRKVTLFLANLIIACSYSCVNAIKIGQKESTAVVYLHEQQPVRSAGQDTLYKLIDNNKRVIVIFYEDWCGPCKRMTPILEELALMLPDIVFVKVKREAYRTIFDDLIVKQFKQATVIVKQFKQATVPAILFYNNGKLVNHQLFSTTKEGMLNIIRKTYA